MSETIQALIVAIILIAAVIGIIRHIRRSKQDPGCCDCPIADTCNKKKKRKK